MINYIYYYYKIIIMLLKNNKIKYKLIHNNIKYIKIINQ